MITTKDPAGFEELGVSIVTDDNAVIAIVELRTDGRALFATGSSKRHPGDPRTPVAGQQLALGRALSQLGAALTDAGNKNAG